MMRWCRLERVKVTPGCSSAHGRPARVLDHFLGGLLYRCRLRRFVGGSCFGLAGSLVLRQIEPLLDFVLPADHLLVTLLVLEVCAVPTAPVQIR